MDGDLSTFKVASRNNLTNHELNTMIRLKCYGIQRNYHNTYKMSPVWYEPSHANDTTENACILVKNTVLQRASRLWMIITHYVLSQALLAPISHFRFGLHTWHGYIIIILMPKGFIHHIHHTQKIDTSYFERME